VDLLEGKIIMKIKKRGVGEKLPSFNGHEPIDNAENDRGKKARDPILKPIEYNYQNCSERTSKRSHEKSRLAG